MAPVALQVPLTGSYSSAEATRRGAAGGATRHEHPAIGQQRGGVIGAKRDHVPGGTPGPADRVVQLCGRPAAGRPS